MNTEPQAFPESDTAEDRVIDALIALALHPRYEELTPLIVEKMDAIDADLAALRAKGWIIEQGEGHPRGWNFHHEDYDGAPDSHDTRCGWGSLLDCIAEMKELGSSTA